MNISDILPVITFLLALSGIAGSALAYRNVKVSNVAQVQTTTIDAMQHQIDALKDECNSLRKENDRLSYIIDTICSALKQKSIILTIEGELITLEDGRSQHSKVVRRSTRKTTTNTNNTTTGGGDA